MTVEVERWWDFNIPQYLCWSSQLNVEFNGGGILILPNTFVDLPNGMQSCNNIWLGMGTLYTAKPGQSPGVARIYIYTYNIYTHHLDDYMLSGYYYIYIPTTHS